MATLHTIFESVHKLPAGERQAWYMTHDTPSTIQMEVEELLRYDGLAEEEAFLAARLSAAERDSLVGKNIGPYRITRLIGHGGMGSVYHAERHVPYQQEVALKVADVRLRTGAARFQIERQLLADLQHPGIACILDGGTLPDERPYLVMEYVPGEHIDSYADKHKLRVMERVALWQKVCEAVAAAHARGVVHRDLKPSNILVTEAGRVVVVDFGLARRWEDVGGLTQTAMVMGTPEYMAPEQASGRKTVITPAADVYALGAVLYTLLTGRPPFRADTPFNILTMSLQEEPVSPRRLNLAVSRDLETLCLHCLKKKPDERYTSAKEVVEETERFLHGEPVRAKPMGLLATSWRSAKRRPALAVLSGLLLVTIITSLVAIGFYWRKAYYSLETAKVATVQLFAHAIKLTNEPGMQKAQVDLLSKAIHAYDPLVRTLNEVQITLQYLAARRVLLESAAALGDRDNEDHLSEELLRDTETFVKAYPFSSDIELEWALALRRMGNQEAINLDSRNRQEHLRASLAYHQQAEAIMNRLSVRHPERDSLRGYHAEIHTRIAATQSALGLASTAEKHLVQARVMFKQLYEKYHPEDPQALIRFCQLLFAFADSIEFQADKDQLYRELLEEAYQLDVICQSTWPERYDHRTCTYPGAFRLARWLERKGEWERARKLYVNLIALGEKLMENYPDVLHHSSMLSELLCCYANVCYAQGKTSEAQQSYARSFALREKTLARSSVRSAFELFFSGSLLSCPMTSLRDVERAEALLQQHPVQLANENYLYQLCLGRIRLRQNRLVEAKEALTRALELKPWNAEATEYHLYLALVHAKLGEVAKAKEYLDLTKEYFQRYSKDVQLGTLRTEVEESLDIKH